MGVGERRRTLQNLAKRRKKPGSRRGRRNLGQRGSPYAENSSPRRKEAKKDGEYARIAVDTVVLSSQAARKLRAPVECLPAVGE
jgi:hypothetical protein